MLHEALRTLKNETDAGASPCRQRLPGADRSWNLAILILCLGALAGAWLWIELTSGVPVNLAACFSVRLFHRPCPMCGLTRGLHAVWQGDLAGARAFHPLSIAVFALLAGDALARVAMLLARCSRARWKQIARADVVAHAALACAYCGYAAAWLLHRWMA